MNQNKYISLKELSERLNMDRSHARRYLKRLGVKTQKRRTPDSGNQLCLTVTEKQAAEIIEARQNEGFLNSDKSVITESGFFYVIQLVPELDPNRLKLGFAININERLSQHRTAAPTSVVVKSWPCKRSWETTVMDCLASVGCRLILNEVFECDDIEKLLKKGDELFSILPNPGEKPGISEKSPLNGSLAG
jgi:hypothetical protein